MINYPPAQERGNYKKVLQSKLINPSAGEIVYETVNSKQ